jgi:hypothetical protein
MRTNEERSAFFSETDLSALALSSFTSLAKEMDS